MEPLQSLLGIMAALPGNHEDLSEAEAEMKLALEEACQEAGVTLSPAMSPKALCVFNYRENMPGVGKMAGWLRTTRRQRKMPAFQRIASQRRCKSAEELPRMQAISEEQIQVVGLAAGGGQHLPSRLHRGNSEPETGRADLEDADLDEGLGQTMRPLSPLSPANILERLGSARELDIASEKLDWSGLAAVYRTEHADEPSDSGSDGVMEIKINSGGVVYFAAFQYPKPPREQGEGGPSETGGTHRGNLGSPLGPYHASQMAVTTSQEGAAMVVRAYGSQGMTQLTFPSPMTAHPGATSPGAPLEPAAPPSPQGASGQELDTGAGPERSEATGAGLKVRTASRMAKPSADAHATERSSLGPAANGTRPSSDGAPWQRPSPVRQPRVEVEEFAACIKFGPSRLATQSERLGSELARHLGVPTPQARVIHSGSEEWAAIQAAVNQAKSRAVDKIQVLAAEGRGQSPAYKAAEDEERTCEELLDALRIFRCLLLMGYVHGKSLKDSPSAFEGPVEQAATAAALGRVLVLDLVLRNEDRLAVKRLGWQENAGNLRYTERLFTTPKTPAQLATEVTAAADLVRVKSKGRAKARSAENKLRPAVVSGAGGSSPSSVILHKRSMSAPNVREIQEASILDPLAVPAPGPSARGSVVVIDSGIPRRPPAAKMEADRENFPKLMELLLCDVDVAAEVLREVSSGYLPATSPSTDGATAGPEEEPHGGAQAEDVPSLLSSDPSQAVELSSVDQAAAERRLVEAFQRGVRETVEAVHGLRPLLSRLHQRLDGLLRAFIACIGEVGRAEQRPSPGAPRRLSGAGLGHSPSARKPPSPKDPKKPLSPKDPRKPPSPRDTKLPTPPSAVRTFNRAGSGSPGENGREPGSPLRGSPLRFTIRLKDWQKVAKVDDTVSDMLEEWDAKLRREAAAVCESHGFVTGFLEWDGGHSLVDSYELKVRLEHVLERVGLILAGAEAQRPSAVLPFLYVGGVAAARSRHVLQHLGITHIVNMAPDDTLGEDGTLGEFPDCFHYTHYQARDTPTEDIGRFFEPASALIDTAAAGGGKVLVHCFEGKSRSVAVVLAYLMLHKARNLAQAWAEVRAVHPRAAPNDGFAAALVRLEKRLHGPVASMEWKGKKPAGRLCPVCGKSAGVSTDSLRVHLRKVHPNYKAAPLPPPAC